MSPAVTFTPSSRRSRFSSRIFRLKGSRLRLKPRAVSAGKTKDRVRAVAGGKRGPAGKTIHRGNLSIRAARIDVEIGIAISPAGRLAQQNHGTQTGKMSTGIDYSAGQAPSTVGAAMTKAPKQRDDGNDWAGTHRIRNDFIADEACEEME